MTILAISSIEDVASNFYGKSFYKFHRLGAVLIKDEIRNIETDHIKKLVTENSDFEVSDTIVELGQIDSCERCLSIKIFFEMPWIDYSLRIIYLNDSNYYAKVQLLEKVDGTDKGIFQSIYSGNRNFVYGMFMSYGLANNYLSRYEFSIDGQIKQIEFSPPVKRISDIYRTGYIRPSNNTTVLVGLMDTGIDYNLPELANKLLREPMEDSEDFIGIDFVDNDTHPFDYELDGPFDTVKYHGTGVASVILEETDYINLLPLRFIPGKASAKQAVNFAKSSGVRIINLSAGSPDISNWEEMSKVIASSPDILFVVSAGNEGLNIDQTPYYPAGFNFDNILVVTSSTRSGRLSSFSNYGKSTVDVAAQGEDVYVLNPGSGYSKVSGTSYAAARVTKLAALLLSIDPTFRVNQVKDIILSSVNKKAELKDVVKSSGVIDRQVARRLAEALSSSLSRD